ncbi:uncharacterized protein [Dasypus novemcinctus]|uniref:uncharacterized protein n=1 Tax=Dasypus novemcinctus TaxID=9361 RepID=UPI0039C94FBF
MSGAAALFFLVFLTCRRSAELHSLHVTKGSPQEKTFRRTEFASSSNKQEEKLGKIFDEILQQVASIPPYNPTFNEISKAAKPTSGNVMKSSYPQPEILGNTESASSSMKPGKDIAKLLNEIRQPVFSNVPFDPTFDDVSTAAKSTTENIMKPIYSMPKTFTNTESTSNSKGLQEQREIFDQILRQVLYRVPYNPAFDEMGITTQSPTENIIKQSYPQPKILEKPELASNSEKQRDPLRNIFDEVLRYMLSKPPYNPIFDEIPRTAASKSTTNVMNQQSYSQSKTSKNTEFASNLNKQEKNLNNKLFDEILRHQSLNVPSSHEFDETRSAARTTAKNIMKPTHWALVAAGVPVYLHVQGLCLLVTAFAPTFMPNVLSFKDTVPTG